MLVVGVETGGTITGLAKTLKTKIPGLKVVGVEPEHSSIQDGVNRSSAWKVEDIGGNFTPAVLNKALVDAWIKVSDQESYSTARQIIREDGLYCGMLRTFSRCLCCFSTIWRSPVWTFTDDLLLFN